MLLLILLYLLPLMLLSAAGHLVKQMQWLEFLLQMITLNHYSGLFCLRLILASILFPQLLPLCVPFIRSVRIYFLLKSNIGTQMRNVVQEVLRQDRRHHLKEDLLRCSLAILSQEMRVHGYYWNAACSSCFRLPKGSLFPVCNIVSIITEV